MNGVVVAVDLMVFVVLAAVLVAVVMHCLHGDGDGDE